MKFTNLFLLFLLGTVPSLFAQTHQHTHDCGVHAEAGQLIKERMLRNRATISPQAIEQAQNNRNITYIPIAFTIVGNDDGEGYTPVPSIIATLCQLNINYAPQDIQFYIKDQIYYLNNQSVFENAFGNLASNIMVANKKPNCLNIFVSPSSGDASASYYSPWGDYVFLLRSMIDGRAATATHELGHFFTLPHTFYGWEGVDFDNTTADPNAIWGTIENVARTGNDANCYSSADGFCDTPADYVSYRASCPYYGGGFDPLGQPIDPDETNYMSYYYDNCISSFSDEQKDAMMADIISRGWDNLSLPVNATEVLDSNAATINYPQNTDLVSLDQNVTLSWEPVDGAVGYYIAVNQTFLGSTIDYIVDQTVYGATQLTIDKSLFLGEREYTWSVYPFGLYETCDGRSSSVSFTTDKVSAIQHLDKKQPVQLQWVNTSSLDVLQLLVSCEENMIGTLGLYNISGQQLLSYSNRTYNSGQNMEYLDISTLSKGTYVVVLRTASGSLIQKFTR